ncbi:MAG: response regulator [Betaproteobacteria bacterium]|nr:response regulator [Betaproteobacteria bacterium]
MQMNGKVLVIDDDRLTLILTGAFLSRLGVPYETAFDQQEAIEKFTRTPFSLVLLDLQLPGTDGFEIIRMLRACPAAEGNGVANANTPIIAVTGYAREEVAKCCQESGFVDVLTKPYSIEQLSALLATWLK